MRISDLKLERCFFSKINVEAAPAGISHSKKGIFETSTEIVPVKEKEHSWQVTLTVRLASVTGSEPSPYVGELKVVGIFQVAPEYPAEKKDILVSVNGPAVLYGMAREMISNITARGPYPMICLPTVTFIDQYPQQTPKSSKSLPTSNGKKRVTDTKNSPAVKGKRSKK